MEEKRDYQTPEMTVVTFDAEDVITTSNRLPEI